MDALAGHLKQMCWKLVKFPDKFYIRTQLIICNNSSTWLREIMVHFITIELDFVLALKIASKLHLDLCTYRIEFRNSGTFWDFTGTTFSYNSYKLFSFQRDCVSLFKKSTNNSWSLNSNLGCYNCDLWASHLGSFLKGIK